MARGADGGLRVRTETARASISLTIAAECRLVSGKAPRPIRQCLHQDINLVQDDARLHEAERRAGHVTHGGVFARAEAQEDVLLSQDELRVRRGR